MKYTTTNLRLTIRDRWLLHERHIRDGAIGGMFVVTLLLIHSLFAPAPEPMQPLVVQQAPAILLATAQPLPTLPPLPTLTPAPTAEPVVVEVPVYQEPVYVPVEVPVYVAPTLAPAEYQSQPETFAESLIGDDPDALACTNPETGKVSPLCGGITNAEAADALERQRNIQNHPANEHAGGSGKMRAPDVTFDASAEWCASATNGARCVEMP